MGPKNGVRFETGFGRLGDRSGVLFGLRFGTVFGSKSGPVFGRFREVSEVLGLVSFLASSEDHVALIKVKFGGGASDFGRFPVRGRPSPPEKTKNV